MWEQEYFDIQAITKNLKKLHTLTIESELNCDEEFFDIIRQNCKELKSLNLNMESLKVDISTVADIHGLRFRKFPFTIKVLMISILQNHYELIMRSSTNL